MDEILTLDQAITAAHNRWGSRVEFKKKNYKEAYSRCPWCGGHDRFLIFAKGNYWCRPGDGHCGKSGWILENQNSNLTPEELQRLAIQNDIAELKRKTEEHEKRITALEKMAQSQAHIFYHKALSEKAIEYWHKEGITDKSIDRWLLGYCDSVPLYPSLDSVTIPVINLGKLKNIRHRTFNNDIRYLPHMKDLGMTLFNADALFKEDKSMVILYEGEKKSIVAAQNGFEGPALLGSNAFKDEWVPYFQQFDTVYICLDSDAIETAVGIGEKIGNARIVELPGEGKVDDLFNWGMTKRDFCDFLRKARRV